MWTSTLELSPRRVILTRLLGSVWPDAYFSSFAPLQVQNLPRQPLPAANWVRVRNRLAGICGSDLHLIYGDGDFRIAPAAIANERFSYPGHEVVGEVIEVGDEVQRLQVGDRVVLQHSPNCVTAGVEPICHSCAIGNFSLCERADLPGPKPFGGGWSEEMLVHEQQLFPVPPDMSDEQAALLEPSSVAVHAALRHLPQPDEHVLIIGAGTIGLLTLQAIHALSPQTRISVQARHAFQVEQAMRMGATQILYPQDNYTGVQRATGAHLYTGMMGNSMLLGGYDVIYDTVGSKRTLSNALRWTRAGGTVVLVGVNLHLMRIDLTPIWFQEVNLVGTYGNGMETWPPNTNERRSTFAITSDLIIQRQLFPEKLITHRFALNNYRQALTTATGKAQSRAIKVLFDYSLLPASVVPNVRAAAQQRQPLPGRVPSPSTPYVTWQPVPSPSPMVIPAPPAETPDFIPTPLTTPEEVPAPSSIEAPPPSEETPPSIAPAESIIPAESQETQQANQVQDDENSPATVVVRKPKYTRQKSKVQEPNEIVQANNQLQEEMPDEPGAHGEAAPDATTGK